MTEKACSRLWQVEAVLDDVLSRADVASFERHVVSCPQCAAERAALARLVRVAQRLPALEVPPLRRRALRNELLRRANELSTGAAPARAWRFRKVAPVLLFALAAFALVLWQGLASRPVAFGVEPGYRLSEGAGARWRVVDRGRSLRLSLEAGQVTIAVSKLEGGQRFIVTLPDGELEVRGTRFTVACHDGRTEHVSVAEGRVALRLQGQLPLSLGAGEAWPQKAARPAVEPAPAAEHAVASDEAPPTNERRTPLPPTNALPSVLPKERARVVAPVESVTPSSTRPSPTRVRAASAAPGGANAEPEPSRASGSAKEFAEAMAVFSRGDFGTAERLFSAFEERYPSSPHVEDMLFLKALGRSRRGDTEGARRLSLEYLRRFPGGFRSVEAQRLAAPRRGLAEKPGLVTFPSE